MESKYQYGSLDTPKNPESHQVDNNKRVKSKDEIPKEQKTPKKK